jgi:hypothetical protein
MPLFTNDLKLKDTLRIKGQFVDFSLPLVAPKVPHLQRVLSGEQAVHLDFPLQLLARLYHHQLKVREEL